MLVNSSKDMSWGTMAPKLKMVLGSATGQMKARYFAPETQKWGLGHFH